MPPLVPPWRRLLLDPLVLPFEYPLASETPHSLMIFSTEEREVINLPLKKSAKGEFTPKNSRNTSSGGRKTNGKPPIISKSSKS